MYHLGETFLSADNFLALDQARQIGPDLDPNCLTPGWYLENPASKEREKYPTLLNIE